MAYKLDIGSMMKKSPALLFLFSFLSLGFLDQGLAFENEVRQQVSHQCIFIDGQVLDTGYSFTPRRKDALVKNYWLRDTKKYERSEILERIERLIEVSNRDADIGLADPILRLAEITGIDPFIFASLVRKESTFKPDAISHTNAVGLTQMTTIAFAELRNQFGVGAPRFTPQASEIFFGMSVAFFKSQEKAQEYVAWLATTTKLESRRRVLVDTDYSLLTGALLFKIKLALTGGQYQKSLEGYNGSAVKAPYARQILTATARLQRTSDQCITPNYSLPVLLEACELSGDKDLCQAILGQIEA